MIQFLSNISRFDVITDVILLSRKGEMIYGTVSSGLQAADRQSILWKGLIAFLRKPEAAEFYFADGLYYVSRTEVGYLILGVKNSDCCNEIKAECDALRSRLQAAENPKLTLMQILEKADDEHKPQIVEELIELADGQIGENLLKPLNDGDDFPTDAKDRLLADISRGVGNCTIADYGKQLQVFLDDCKKQERVSSKVESTVLASIRKLGGEEKVLPREHDNSSEEKRVKQLLAAGKKNEACAIILKFIEAAARQGKYKKAENLCKTIGEIDGSFAEEMNHASTLIEEAKFAAVDPDRMETWEPLADMLSQGEYASLYHAMNHRQFKNGEIIVEQGAFLSQLFFINRGEVQLFAVADGKEIPLKMLGAGEIMGGEAFFQPSVWTLNARSLDVDLSILSRKDLFSLADKYPVLESKLQDYDSHSVSPRMLFTRTKRTRRRFERTKVTGATSVSLMDKHGTDTGVEFRGDLIEISKGGVSFGITISRKRNALLLFGGRIKISIPQRGSLSDSIQLHAGRIVAVRDKNSGGDEYSIHVEFSEMLEQHEIDQIAG